MSGADGWRCYLAVPGDLRARPGAVTSGEPCMVDLDDRYGAFCLRTLLSAEYRRDWLGRRLPLFVLLPNGEEFSPDFAYAWARGKEQQGWTATGTPPLLTVQPSINCIGRYHGWLQGGLLSPDLEGRRYPPFPAV